MKVKSSKYLKEVKPLLVHLRDRLLEEYPYVSILASDSVGKQYSVSKDITSISMISWLTGQGFVVKVYDGASYGEYSFNEISEDGIDKIVSKIKGELLPLSQGLPDGVKKSVYAMLEDTPTVFEDMKQMICEIMHREASDEYNVPLYVLTNRHGTDGAGCTLYPDLLKDFSEALGSSFYIIPSSVHEVLFLPADDTDKSGELREMIKEVNDTQLIPEEILSYSLYYYDREMDEVSIIQ